LFTGLAKLQRFQRAMTVYLPMKTYLDCYRCVFRHGLEAWCTAVLSEDQQKKILNEMMKIVQQTESKAMPPQGRGKIRLRKREEFIIGKVKQNE
jgi:hypothetical protein